MSIIQDAALQYKNAKKATILRHETDPAKKAQVLTEILSNAINLQGSGSKMFQKRALDELKQVRKDLVNNQITAGAGSSLFITKYSAVIDEIERMNKDNKSDGETFNRGLESLQRSIPSGDSLVAALMSANPMMGYGVKIMRDLNRARVESKKAAVQSARKEVERLKSLEAAASVQEQQQEQQQEILDTTQEAQKKEKRSYKRRSGIYEPVLTEIRDRISLLERFISANTEIIEETKDATEDQVKAIEDASQDQILEMQRIEAERIRAEELSRVDNSTAGGGSPVPDIVNSPEVVPEPEKESLFAKIFGGAISALGGALGSITGIFTAFAGGGVMKALLSPFKGMVNFIVGIGKFALTLGKAVFLPALIIGSLYSFFDGFFNAGKILGQNEDGTSFGERIGVGISNIFGNIIKVVDWVLGLFGLGGLINSEGMTKKIYDFFAGIPEAIGLFFQGIADSFNDGTLLTKVVGGIIKFYKGMGKTILSFGKKVIGIYADIYKSIFNYMSNVNWGEVLKDTVEGFGNFFNNIFENFKSLFKEYLPESAYNMLFGSDAAASSTVTDTGGPKPYTGSTVPLIYADSASGSKNAGSVIERAEQNIVNKSNTSAPLVMNAPSNTTNVANNNFGKSNTYNPNQLLGSYRQYAFVR